MQECNGTGFCLLGDNSDSCPDKCVSVKCANFLVCDTILPKCITYVHKGTCMSCAYTFGKAPLWNGKLSFYESVECPICFEEKPGIKHPNCDHKVCIECFKSCIYGTRIRSIPEPVFPYPAHIEDEYENNHEDPRFKNDPLIIKYNEDFRIYETTLENNYENEANLRSCGLCRK